MLARQSRAGELTAVAVPQAEDEAMRDLIRSREECLNAHWFLSLDDAKRKIEAWRRYYNEARPHTALDWATPAEFARRCGLQPASAVSEEPEISTLERY